MDEYDPTIEDAYQRQCVIDGESAILDILDTAGKDSVLIIRTRRIRCNERDIYEIRRRIFIGLLCNIKE